MNDLKWQKTEQGYTAQTPYGIYDIERAGKAWQLYVEGESYGMTELLSGCKENAETLDDDRARRVGRRN